MSTLIQTTLLLLLLSAPALSQSSWEEADAGSFNDCQPETPPPLADSNATEMVALQMHQWVWIENLTAPDWAPRTDSGNMFYEFLRPGYVRQQRLLLRTPYLQGNQVVYVNTSFVTNGVTLCAAALTQYRNRSSGQLDRVDCSRICYENFTTQGKRANLPLLVYDNTRTLSRFYEYLAFDSVHPDTRKAYNCTGVFRQVTMRSLESYLSLKTPCPEGDECLFNYDNTIRLGYAAAGCKSSFSSKEYSWCVSDINLCSYNIDGDCPLCCRGELCNLELARAAYKRWEKGAASALAAQAWLLGASCISLLWLLR